LTIKPKINILPLFSNTINKKKTIMYFKEDWITTREWLTGWWNQEVTGHWALGVSAPREKPLEVSPAPSAPKDFKKHWLDTEGNLLRSEAEMARHYFGGCWFPYLTAGLGPGVLNLFLGSEPEFMKDTVWYNPITKDPASLTLQMDKQNKYWLWTIKTTEMYLEKSKGRFITGIPDLIEGIDILAQLLGNENLLMSLLDCPAEIHRLLDQLDDIYFEAFDPLYNLVKDNRNGNAFIAFNAWGNGRTIKSQCDFSAMISPDMFAEFVVPHLKTQCERVDYCVYHLDGPDAVKHINHIVSVDKLNAVQWIPGDGSEHPSPADKYWWNKVWEPVYNAGKSAMLHYCPPQEIEPFVKHFGQAGTFISTSVENEYEAKKLIEESVNW
jgi:hypothetical protein